MPSTTTRRSERNVRLDPMGIYGTRSERRRQQLQRRRQWQNGILWLLGVTALSFGAWWVLQPHPTMLRASWVRQMPFEPATAPVLGANGDLYLASQSGGLWHLPFSGAPTEPTRLFATAFAPGASPLVGSKTVFWPGADGVLNALDLGGHVKWSRALPSTLVASPAVAHAKERAIVADGDDESHFGAFDAASGAPLWTHALPGAVGQGLAATDEPAPSFIIPTLAGANSGGGLICLDARTGALRWRFPADAGAPNAGIAAPTLMNNRIYWCNDEGGVVALDAKTGRKIWKTFAAPRPAPKGDIDTNTYFVTLRGAPAVVEKAKVVVVGGSDGLLRAFDTETGAARWTLNVGGPALYAAQVIDFEGASALLASGDSQGIFLLEPATGRVLRRWATPFDADFGVIAAGNTALALDAEGHLQGAPMR